jgi:hypothetical protein
VLVRLKTPWRDGTSHIALQPLELLEKLAALIPRPYIDLIVYYGVLAPNAKWRRGVVDFGWPQRERPSSATTPKKVGPSHNRTWAELMRRGLDIDVLECPDCGRAPPVRGRRPALQRRPPNPPSSRSSLRPRPGRTCTGTPELDDAWAC